MARHRSPRGRGASGPLLAATGGAHRAVDAGHRRNLVAVGGAVALAGQMAFLHASADSGTLLPDLAALVGLGPPEATITDLSVAPSVSPVMPVSSAYDGLGPVTLGADNSALQQADAAKLAKAAGLEAAARATEERAARQAELERARLADSPAVRGSRCAPNLAGLAGVKPWVSTAGTELRCVFGVRTVGGLGGRAGASDHPRGLAVDFMTTGMHGDQLANYALKYRDELKIKYVIWKQRINYGHGWRRMPSRGSGTANHMDHVHISFRT